MVDEKIPISDENEAFFEYGKKILTEPVEVIKDYIKLMIPLTTALITSYLALLNFVGKEYSLNNNSNLLVGPILLLASLLTFIITSFPIPSKLTITNIESIRKYIRKAMWHKYIGSAIGSALFLIGF